MKLPTYPRTKPSGVDWLGDVPEHWEVKPLKHLTDFINGAPFKPEDWSQDGVPIIRIENLNGGDNFNGYEGSVRERYHVSKGDLLFGWSGNRGTSFGPFLWPREGLHYLNQHIFRLAHFSCDRSWFYWALKAVTKTIEDEAHGIIGMVHVTKGKLGAVQIPFLPPAEQRSIAAFLDRETGRVDRLVAKKRELIERLTEKRTALISRTVTRGLPPAAARAAGLREITVFKDSGIPWLGKVPKHWSVLPFRRVTTRVDVGIAEAATHAYADEGVPLVRSTNIKFETVDTSDLLFIEEEFAARLRSKALRAGDIVTTRTGANLGVSAIIPKSLHMTQCFTLLISTLAPDSEPRFYNAFINADPGRIFFAMASLGAGQHNISVPILKEMPTVRPPLQEQAAIAAYLDKETAKLDALVGKVEEAVERLQEYRTALITAAVTGKIDVRNEVAP